MNNSSQEYLRHMGITTWQERKKNTSTNNHDSWSRLFEEISQCHLCPLHQSRTHTVFGEGSSSADLLLIGEAPGAQEDLEGKPFVGRAGKLLASIRQALGLNEFSIFITNILKCRPPQNREPSPSEVTCCTPYLKQQIFCLKPKLIVALGRISAHFLLNTSVPLHRLRMQKHRYEDQNIPLVVTYHPAYLLRSPQDKSKSYEDWLWIKQLLIQLLQTP
jgi:uracil-DNA glycosylase